MNKEQIQKFMQKNMIWIGWGNWTFAIKRVKKLDNAMAMIEPSEIGKQYILSIPDEFMKLNDNMQKSILIHELIHGRECVRQTRVEKYCDGIKETEEELFINDVEKLTMNWED